MSPIDPRRALRWRPARLRAVLFDLDGTLVETAGDIALALNRSLADAGYPTVGTAAVRAWIGRGAATLVSHAIANLGLPAGEGEHAALLQGFFAHYARLHASGESTASAFPGAAGALRELRNRELKLAVVTNKQRSLALDALAVAGLGLWPDVVVGGDTCGRLKPDPEPLRHACREIGVAPHEAVMVGDSATDVTAARAAGMAVVCVPYGYNDGQPARELPCDELVERLDELPALLFAGARVAG